MRSLFILCFCLPAMAAFSSAAEWRLRARENFETGRIDIGDGRGRLDYNGFISAFSLVYEKPFDSMFGLTVQRGSLERIGPSQDRLTTTTLGFEAKIFPLKAVPLWFARGGVLAGALDPAGPGKESWLYGGSAGSGFEIPIWKLGVAPEAGVKSLWGARSRFLRHFYLAIGLHFYVFPGDVSSEK
jgi:hypothetical protein